MEREMEGFKKELIHQRKDNKTIKSYIRDVELFLQYIDNKPLSDIDYFDIEDYKTFLLQQGYKVTSINRKMVAINRFITYCGYKVEVRQEKVHMQNFLDNTLTTDEVQAMVDKAEELKDYRAKALILTLYYTGMRISECLSITVNNISKDYITILGKGKKFRNVLVPKKLKSVWNEYMDYRVDKSNKLFTGQKGAITRQCADLIIKKYARLAGVDVKKAHMHNLRHVFCKNLADNNVSIDVIAELAGHNSLDTSRIYTRKTKQELLNIIENL
ncbi:tyrosine-type recombinase/integrase [Clostridium brassicae]|uniref:Tyrosine-type recombinase/integrase n=1 Tax=Clostridium brassicae TaxID=2999072 RepID=A0ABT4DCJ1_9CLOT|nr:tyrosine-type recombinase/integrase [Clostridium brassicae]MCY6960007.1 tyrosine-type recombinase/integrase [Clostridium brassicae]